MAAVFRQGTASINDAAVGMHHIALLDAGADGVRDVAMEAGPGGASVMLFAGKRLRQPVAWHGPFVMTTNAEIKV